MIIVMKRLKKYEPKNGKLHTRAYRTAGDRKRAIAMLRKHGFNYFVCYLEACARARNANQQMALQVGVADWVKPGGYYVDW